MTTINCNNQDSILQSSFNQLKLTDKLSFYPLSFLFWLLCNISTGAKAQPGFLANPALKSGVKNADIHGL